MDDRPFLTEKEALQEELKRRYHNLALLRNREATYGSLNAPLSLLNEIAQETERIAEIEARLAGLNDEPSPAAQYFSKGTRAMLLGDYWEAERYFKLTLRHDPYYPRAKELLADTRKQISLREGNEVKEVIQLGPNWKKFIPLIGVALVVLLILVALWTVGWLF